MSLTPHRDKILAAIKNPKCPDDDKMLLQEALSIYDEWKKKLHSLTSKGQKRVREMVELLNWYKDLFEVELIMKQGSSFIKRQKGQLKLDNSILEEFLIELVNPDVFDGLDTSKLEIGPKNAFMSLSFIPRSFKELPQKPRIFVKTKAHDFVIGTKIYYKFSTTDSFDKPKTVDGDMVLAVLVAECKVNLDKTMFQEAAGTAARLKQGCPVAKYFLLVEYLDMVPEDCRLTAIDNVFLLRHARRLPFEKRNDPLEVEKQHKNHPIDHKVVWMFVQEIQKLMSAIWYDPDEALRRGSFV